MTDQELRALVRDAVARHFSGAPRPPEPFGAPPGSPVGPSAYLETTHASHAMYLTLVNVGDACVIEPGVTCNHCGYCKSHGH